MIYESNEGNVFSARHSILGLKVVIKSVASELYHSKEAKFSISEVGA